MLCHEIKQNEQRARQKTCTIGTYSLLIRHIDKIMFIIVTNDATTAMVTTFLLSAFDNVWAFGMFELVFRGMVEDSFFLSVVVVEFCVIGLFERVFLVDADGWSLFPAPFFDLVVAFVVTGVFVVVENRCAEVLGIGS